MKGISAFLNIIKMVGKYGGLIIAIMKAIEVLKDEVEKLNTSNEKSTNEKSTQD